MNHAQIVQASYIKLAELTEDEPTLIEIGRQLLRDMRLSLKDCSLPMDVILRRLDSLGNGEEARR